MCYSLHSSNQGARRELEGTGECSKEVRVFVLSPFQGQLVIKTGALREVGGRSGIQRNFL